MNVSSQILRTKPPDTGVSAHQCAPSKRCRRNRQIALDLSCLQWRPAADVMNKLSSSQTSSCSGSRTRWSRTAQATPVLFVDSFRALEANLGDHNKPRSLGHAILQLHVMDGAGAFGASRPSNRKDECTRGGQETVCAGNYPGLCRPRVVRVIPTIRACPVRPKQGTSADAAFPGARPTRAGRVAKQTAAAGADHCIGIGSPCR